MPSASGSEWQEVLPQLERQRVIACEWQGMPAFAKRVSRGGWFRRACLVLFSPSVRWLLCPRIAFVPKPALAGPFEVCRLTALRDAGVRVPRVLATTPAAFVVERAGTPLDEVIARSVQEGARARWILAATDDLIGFHSNGHWHGGAQIRNVAVSADGSFARFDFDRDLDRFFPLAFLQALDVFLFFTSLAGVESEAGIERVARRYGEHASAGTQAVLRRVAPFLRRLSNWRWFHGVAPTEARRLKVSAVALGVIAKAERSGMSSRPS